MQHKVTFKKNRFIGSDRTVAIKEGTSLLDAARLHGVPMGDHCGGTGGCTGSHVYVVLGMENLSEIDDKEDRILDTATFVTETSRLGCMARVQGDVTVIITD
jgi:2Fe-2S ferredoxin